MGQFTHADKEEAEPEAPAALTVPAPATGPAALLALQRTVGNAAATQIVQRKLLDLVPGHPDAEWWAQVYQQERKDRQAFIDAGRKGPITYDPSKRNKENYYGGFDVEYDPQTQVMKVTLKGVVDFQPGMKLVKNLAVPVEQSAATAQEAKRINKLPKADRPAEVNKWNWSSAGGPDAGDDTTFLSKFETAVEDAWKGKHSFHCTRPGWEDLGATVDIDVQVVKLDAANKAGSPNHVKITAHKVPPGHQGHKAFVNRPGGAKGGAYANVMVLTSKDVDPRDDYLLWRAISFKEDSAALDAEAKKRIKAIAKELPNAKKDSNVPVPDIEIRTAGKDDTQRADRATAIEAALVEAGMDTMRIMTIDTGAAAQKSSADPKRDLLWIVIGNGEAQVVAAHESGHVFGLDDEYINSANADYAAGKKTEHEPLAAKAGLRGVMHATSDSIMAGGNVVREQHYLTFLDALKVVTGMEQWTFGGPQAPDLPDALKPLPPDDF